MKKVIIFFTILLICGCVTKQDYLTDFSINTKQDIIGLNMYPKNPSMGFHHSYFMYVPPTLSNDEVRIIVRTNNAGYASNDYQKHIDDAYILADASKIFADQTNSVLIVPTFPRLEEPDLYTHVLDSETIKTKMKGLRRIDLQLIAIFREVQLKLFNADLIPDKKITFIGFSADGCFANRFSLIHPELVRCAAIGAPGGWPSVPVESYKGYKLKYPLGVNDFEKIFKKSFNHDAFNEIPFYIFGGELDDNHHEDPSYYQTAERVMGNDMDEILIETEKIYNSVGANIEMQVYPYTGHKFTNGMIKNTIRFIKNN